MCGNSVLKMPTTLDLQCFTTLGRSSCSTLSIVKLHDQITPPPKKPFILSISVCDANSRYRTISGRCNNLANPEWGSTGSTFRRFLPPAYEVCLMSFLPLCVPPAYEVCLMSFLPLCVPQLIQLQSNSRQRKLYFKGHLGLQNCFITEICSWHF